MEPNFVGPDQLPPPVKARRAAYSSAALAAMESGCTTEIGLLVTARARTAWDAYHCSLVLAGYKLGVVHCGNSLIMRKCYGLTELAYTAQRAMHRHGFTPAEVEQLYQYQRDYERVQTNDYHRHTDPSLPDVRPTSGPTEWIPFDLAADRRNSPPRQG